MTPETEIEPSDPLNGPVSNGTARGEVAIDMRPVKEKTPIDVVQAESARRLYEIKKDERWTWLLEEWEKQFKTSLHSKLHREARLKHAKNELYQWIGFYSVFQGAVFTAVALSNKLGCRQSWGPTSLSLIASIVTIVSVHFKLVDYGELQTNFERKISEAKQLHAQLAELKQQGTDFQFSWFLEKSEDRCGESGKRGKSGKRGESGKQTVGLKDIYYWAAIGALLLFSSCVVLFCNILLCGGTKYQPGS
ncbi:unnamed protein product [Sphagnum compactum]